MAAKRWRWLAVGMAAVAIVPAVAQRTPESILPPGFDTPTESPPAETPAEPATTPSEPTPQPDTPPDTATSLPRAEAGVAATADTGEPDALENETAPVVELVDLPPAAERAVEEVGMLADSDGGYGRNAFGQQDGRLLATLMQRLDGPLASRWANIMLRRALQSRSATPANLSGADWIAERALLLARMGHADDARALVSAVDKVNYTPRMFDAAMQAAMATADPQALCGVADAATSQSRLPSWALARGMCAGLAGESLTASAILDQIRRDGRAGGVDVRLAEKVAAVGGNARRAINIQWEGVDRLNAWRYGLASATAVPIPDELFSTVGGQVYAWLARAPLYPAVQRLGAADRAAELGVYSNAALVDLYSSVFEELDDEDRRDTPGELLRTAYVGDPQTRLQAMESLWGEGAGDYGRLVLTARAAALLPVSDQVGEDTLDRLLGSMFSAGLDLQAARWRDRVTEGGKAWALLAVGDPRGGTVSADSATGYADGQAQRLFVAALAGLGRTDAQATEQAGVNVTRRDSWINALRSAAAAGETGTVVLLCATGLQTRSWNAVPADYLYHMVASLKQVGLEPEARMLAAEAVMRA